MPGWCCAAIFGEIEAIAQTTPVMRSHKNSETLYRWVVGAGLGSKSVHPTHHTQSKPALTVIAGEGAGLNNYYQYVHRFIA